MGIYLLFSGGEMGIIIWKNYWGVFNEVENI